MIYDDDTIVHCKGFQWHNARYLHYAFNFLMQFALFPYCSDHREIFHAVGPCFANYLTYYRGG